jgi:hypothetical protein
MLSPAAMAGESSSSVVVLINITSIYNLIFYLSDAASSFLGGGIAKFIHINLNIFKFMFIS